MCVSHLSPPHYRDDHKAYVTVNDKTCWTKSFSGLDGKQQCGPVTTDGFGEQSVAVTCEVQSLSGKLKIRVFTDLDQDLSDESFGIDNVVVSQITFPAITAKFDKADDFEGWNCGQIKACGTYGNLCGGQAVKGKGDDITKTFDVPSGTYLVTLDFIAIDSWFVRSRKCAVVVFSL